MNCPDAQDFATFDIVRRYLELPWISAKPKPKKVWTSSFASDAWTRKICRVSTFQTNLNFLRCLDRKHRHSLRFWAKRRVTIHRMISSWIYEKGRRGTSNHGMIIRYPGTSALALARNCSTDHTKHFILVNGVPSHLRFICIDYP